VVFAGSAEQEAGEQPVGRALHVPGLDCLALQEVLGGIPCNQASISGPPLSEVWGQAGHALPVIGAGVPLAVLLPTA